jgi:hypothetical protein
LSGVPDFPPFQPHPGLLGGARMTLIGGLPRRETAALRASAVDRTFDGEDGNRVRARCHPQPRSDAPYVVLLHGLAGDHRSPYVVGTATKAFARGFQVVRLVARSCGGTEELALGSYHGGLTGDVLRVCATLAAERGARVYLVGFSIGANVVLKLAGELGPEAPAWLAGVATLSPCLDFGAAADRMGATAFGRFCERRFLGSLRTIVRRRRELHDPALDLDGIDAIRSIRAFDDRYTAPLAGFAGVEHYYAEASAIRLVERVRVPALLIAARDDPLVPFETLERPEVQANPWLRVLATDHGGHVAFLGSAAARAGGWTDPDLRWGENRLVQLCEWFERPGRDPRSPW